MKVLIVKLSSLGDIIHTFPAITDAMNAKVGLHFDWVVEEAYQDVPTWHPAVEKSIPIALRRWRKNIFSTWRSGEFSNFRNELKQTHYDLVIDAQGLIKSGVVSRMAKGLTVGLSNNTIKEPLATLFYNVRYTVPWKQHAIERVRDLFSRTFNYSIDNRPIDFGFNKELFVPETKAEKKYLVFLHGSSWDSKLWPEDYWKVLAKKAGENGYQVKLLWGNQKEYDRARRISAVSNNVVVQPTMGLTEIARLLSGSEMVISIDTGISHLAAALGVPVIALYGASNHKLTGTCGEQVLNLNSSMECSPCLQKKCPLVEAADARRHWGDKIPPCFDDLPPGFVWEHALGMLNKSVRPIHPFIQRPSKL